jgi:hypothetical protein
MKNLENYIARFGKLAKLPLDSASPRSGSDSRKFLTLNSLKFWLNFSKLALLFKLLLIQPTFGGQDKSRQRSW